MKFIRNISGMSLHALHQPTRSDQFKHLHQLAGEVGQGSVHAVTFVIAIPFACCV